MIGGRWEPRYYLPDWQLTQSGTQNFTNVAISGTLSVGGASTLTGAVSCASTLAVTGATTLSAALTGTSASFSSTLAVTGATTLTDDLAVNGGDLTSTATTFNLLNATVTTLNIGGAATTLAMGAGAASTATLSFTTKINANTGAMDSNQSTVALWATPTTITQFAAATSITVGATTGTCTIRNATVALTGATAFTVTAPTTITGNLTLVGGDIIASTATTWNVLNTVATTVNAFGAATVINVGATSGTTTFNSSIFRVYNGASDSQILVGSGNSARLRENSTNAYLESNGSVFVNIDLNADQSDRVFRVTANGVPGTGTNVWQVTEAGDVTGIGDLAVNGGDITTTATTLNLATTGATTVNAFSAATAINMGAGASTTVTVSATTAVALNTAAITSNQTTVALLNATATTINFGAAASTALNIGNTAGPITFAGTIVGPASTTARATARIPHGSAPTSPTNGDFWTDTSGAYIRINGVTKTFTLT